MKLLNLQGAVLGIFTGEPHDSVAKAGHWSTLTTMMKAWSLEAEAVEWAVKE